LRQSAPPPLLCRVPPPKYSPRVTAGPTRVVHHGDGVAWLANSPLPADHAIVTSLPDVSELPALDLDGWRRWFIDVVALACRQLADDAVAIFFQTDIKRDGVWIDKAHLVHAGVDAAGSHLLWHKIVCRAAAGTITFGRPAYAHLLCASRALRLPPGRSSADVLPALGDMPWPRAMGTAACEAAARFLLDDTACRVVVDPFCGVGTMLAVANAHGMDAIGVELSRRRAARARQLALTSR
jgi:hypothetical protein